MYCSKILSLKYWNDTSVVALQIKHHVDEKSQMHFDVAFVNVQVVNDLYITMEVSGTSKGRRLIYINQTVDYCKAITGKKWDIVSLGFIYLFKDVKTVPKQCPIKKVSQINVI